MVGGAPLLTYTYKVGMPLFTFAVMEPGTAQGVHRYEKARVGGAVRVAVAVPVAPLAAVTVTV